MQWRPGPAILDQYPAFVALDDVLSARTDERDCRNPRPLAPPAQGAEPYAVGIGGGWPVRQTYFRRAADPAQLSAAKGARAGFDAQDYLAVADCLRRDDLRLSRFDLSDELLSVPSDPDFNYRADRHLVPSRNG